MAQLDPRSRAWLDRVRSLLARAAVLVAVGVLAARRAPHDGQKTLLLVACSGASSAALTARCVRRYGDLAAVCVGVLIVSGAINAAYALRTPSMLVESEYGQLLLAKLALFGAMLAIAAVNRWWLTPGLGVPSPAAHNAVRRLRGLAWLELLVGVAVVIVAKRARHVRAADADVSP